MTLKHFVFNIYTFFKYQLTKVLFICGRIGLLRDYKGGVRFRLKYINTIQLHDHGSYLNTKSLRLRLILRGSRHIEGPPRRSGGSPWRPGGSFWDMEAHTGIPGLTLELLGSIYSYEASPWGSEGRGFGYRGLSPGPREAHFEATETHLWISLPISHGGLPWNYGDSL